MMKILLLSPRIDAEHNIAEALVAKGLALLFPDDPEEARQMLQLHGASIDLAIIHLENSEGQTESTTRLLQEIKNDPSQNDLPLILTTDRWSSQECADHQAGPLGANAYLRWPFSETDLAGLIEAVLGRSILDASKSQVTPPPSAQLDISPEPSLEAPVSSEPSLSMSLALGDESQLSDEPPLALSPSSESSLEASELTAEPTVEPSFDSPPEPPQELATEAVSSESLQLSPLPLTPPLSENTEDPEIAQEMPYLFAQKKAETSPTTAASSMIFAEPVGDAVVPGGAANAPDLETFKKYLLLREQDVAVLSNQLRAAHEQIAMVEQLLRDEKAKNTELTHVVNEQKHKIEEFDKDKALVIEGLQSEINDQKFQLKSKTDKVRVLESQVREAKDEMEHLKERVRSDIRKIRVREKELENRLEIMKKDSEALMGARENKIIELKRKVDLMEFNMDLLQDQYTREKEGASKLKERLAKAAQIVRVAGGLLDASKDSRDQENALSSVSPEDELEVKGQKLS